MDERVLQQITLLTSRRPAQTLHVFDIDGPVFREHLLFHLMYAVSGAFPEREKFLYSFRQWREQLGLGVMTAATFYNLVTQCADHGFFVGLPSARVSEIAEREAERLVPQINEFSLELITNLKGWCYEEHPCVLVAVTGSPHEIVVPFCRRLGFDIVASVIYHTGKDGRYTRDRDMESAVSKGLVMDRIASACGVSWEGSIGVGDTKWDIEILKRVSYPIAVNPDKVLTEFVRTSPRVACVEEVTERDQVRILKADEEGRFHEVDYPDILPDYLAKFMVPIRGMWSYQTPTWALF